MHSCGRKKQLPTMREENKVEFMQKKLNLVGLLDSKKVKRLVEISLKNETALFIVQYFTVRFKNLYDFGILSETNIF